MANHLWQSTFFAAAAALLSFMLRNQRAQTRYWLWLAASIKFLIPFSLLVTAGSRIEWRGAPAVAPKLSQTVEQISQPFAFSVPTPLSSVNWFVPLVTTGWILGSAFLLVLWAVRWRRMKNVLRSATALPMDSPILVLSSPARIEPGVFGVFRPVLLLPDGIAGRLTAEQLQAILAHELCHVRRRDNLAAAIHMVVESLFWFHPLVWWIGARLVEERERACDEEVLRLGNPPQVYAESIVNVCKLYLPSPLECASGVTGADLKKRVTAIMTNRALRSLSPTRKFVLAAAAIAAVATPLFIGIVKAQDTLRFEVASIRPAEPNAQGSRLGPGPGGSFQGLNVSVRQLVTFAYNVREFQLSGGPGWMGTERFDVRATLGEPEPPPDPSTITVSKMEAQIAKHRERMRNLLAERFQLAVRRETKELPVYALTVARGGHKMTPVEEGKGRPPNMRRGRGLLTAQTCTMELAKMAFSDLLGRPIVDETGLKGAFDFKLEWTMEQGPPTDPSATNAPTGVSIFTAIQEQLGLKVESKKAPAETIVIEKIEKPSEN